jgi:carbonic anhydrase
VTRQEHILAAVDNGHTIQVNVDAGDTLTLGDQVFNLLQYHFHSPSEHTVNGEHFPMEMHLVHQSTAGALAVIGVFIEEGEHNAAFDPVWGKMPMETGANVKIEQVQVNTDDLLPTDTASWRYHGSLTTPPCSEGVRWIVMQTPIQLDAEQIEQFKKEYTGNNRPTQSLNERPVMTDSLVVE